MGTRISYNGFINAIYFTSELTLTVTIDDAPAIGGKLRRTT
jgi:hypothetical protein